MRHRKKTAWLSLVVLVVTLAPYFAIVAWGPFRNDPLPNLRQLALYGAACVVQLIILGVGHLVLRHRSPDEARTPPDERDLAIMRRSVTFAYNVLIAGMIEVGVIMPFTTSGWTIVNTAFFMIVAAEAVKFSLIVHSYRRQS